MSGSRSAPTEVAFAWAEASTDWQQDGACRGLDVEMFFPAHGEDTSRAKAICGMCQVRTRCLAYAIAHGERFGIWGGLTAKERARLGAEERAQIVRRAVRAA